MTISVLTATPIDTSVQFTVCPTYDATAGCQCPTQQVQTGTREVVSDVVGPDGQPIVTQEPIYETRLVTPHPTYTFGPPPTGEDGTPIEAADTWFARHAKEALLLVQAEQAAQAPAAPATPSAALAGLVGLTL